MNSNARKMTFCVTWVVERTLYTHFWNCSYGFARAGSRGTGAFGGLDRTDSASLRLSTDSNQKRHVICGRNVSKPGKRP